jgi:hypothetical protein
MAGRPPEGDSQAPMEPTKPAGPETQREAAERPGIDAASVAAPAKQGRWQKRRKSTPPQATEVEVPAQLLAAGPRAPQKRDEAPPPAQEPLDMLAILQAAVGPLHAQLNQAIAERRELQTRLDALAERNWATQLEANQARADVEAEQTKRVAAEALAKDLGERLELAQTRIDRLEFEVSIQRKAEAERRVAIETGSARRRWWPFWPA